MTTYIAGTRIGWGDLIHTYILHLATPHEQQDQPWHRDEQLMRATMNHITEEVEYLPGTITVIPLRPPIRPTDTCPTPTPGPSVSSTGPKAKLPS